MPSRPFEIRDLTAIARGSLPPRGIWPRSPRFDRAKCGDDRAQTTRERALEVVPEVRELGHGKPTYARLERRCRTSTKCLVEAARVVIVVEHPHDHRVHVVA